MKHFSARRRFRQKGSRTVGRRQHRGTLGTMGGGGGGGGGKGGINVDARDARETIEMDCQNSPFHRMRIHSCEMCSVNHFFDSSHCTMSTSSWPRKGSSLCQ